MFSQKLECFDKGGIGYPPFAPDTLALELLKSAVTLKRRATTELKLTLFTAERSALSISRLGPTRAITVMIGSFHLIATPALTVLVLELSVTVASS